MAYESYDLYMQVYVDKHVPHAIGQGFGIG